MQLIFLSGSQNVTQGSSHSSTTQTSISNFLNNGKGRSNPRSEANRLPSPNLKVYTYSSLKQATHDFDDEGLLGEGGFGRVFRGWIHPQTLRAGKPGRGIPVAVKKLMPNGSQGHKEWLVSSFYCFLCACYLLLNGIWHTVQLYVFSFSQSEVNFLGQLHHPNLVKLIGYCQEGENRLLVYEYMARGSLESYLFGRKSPFCFSS